MRPAPTATLLLLALASAPITQADVRRCTGPDGGIIYTDRACELVGGRDPVSPPTSTPEASTATPGKAEPPLSSYGPAYSDCARTPDALLFALRRALESHDVNALSGLYHWPGTGGRSAASVVDMLDRLAGETDGSADLIYPEAAFVVHQPEAYPGLPVEDPVGVQVFAHVPADSLGTEANAITLRVLRHAGCWWIHF